MFDSNDKKKPLSERERETLKRLRESLPEYEIHANMRLADAIKADWKQFRSIKGYHLDFVICNQSGDIVVAVELDDSTHDNCKAQERDAKKNKWLSDANIKLIRIREPQEAIGIRRLIDECKHTGVSQASWRPTQPHSNIRANRNKKVAYPFQKIAITVTGMFVIWLVFNNISNHILKRNVEQAPLMPQRLTTQQGDLMQRTQVAENLRKQQESTAQQPRYERLLVRAKSARECARPDGTLDNYTVLCMTDHHEMVLINGHP
jgi:very-short-patch-repair endonuclease